MEPELKATQEEGQRLTHALAQQRTQVTQIRDQMVSLEERVKVNHYCKMYRERMNKYLLPTEAIQS